MASTDGGKSLDADDPLESPTADSVQPSMTIHPVSYSGMPMHMYPFPHGVIQTQAHRSKRRQVKNACTNCQKACKKCDDARPCLRCVKYGIAEECVDSQRKERKKGIKRGPYKKRDGKGNSVDHQVDDPVQPQQQHQQMPISNGVPPPGPPPNGSPPIGYPMTPVGYPPANYYQFAGPPMSKPGEGQPAYYPPFLVPAVPHPQQQHGHPGAEGDNQGYPMAPQFYPAFVPFPQAYGQYMVPARADGQMPMPNTHYPYPPPPHMYPQKAMGAGSSGEMSHGAHMGHAGQSNRGHHQVRHHGEEGVAGKD
ncbi:hypothetical protein PC9H_001202 [Pleurotus ostreatus]|uniref:Transcription activator of gluconeogenesis ERT1 n=2 Tax=Pleurotus ostreatus TaxID=5322 RepID=A0A067P326_PLEO1|nr:uncharacterized protein PC9H_001202 [Pleurotus ostreatus]KAF7440854.1 hypothetical protein PC9H_001202 [Pleurotus ostreatus]KAJ8699711.1 hypothetical protein PTI98_002807 [Pleurotus ostreatus]KDQ33650.1 hypothetical protein PLEOSDRAFT_172367 [Pleurotus ostreatus PC15]